MTRAETVGNVLIVDDNIEFQASVADLAALANCVVTSAKTLREARRVARDGRFDLLVLDLDLPDGSGLDLLDEIDLAALGQVAVVTGHPSVDSAIRAVRLPVVDYLLKPLAPDALNALFERACMHARTRQHRDSTEFSGMIGQSPRMKELFDRVDRVARHDMTVFIHGESGTGKELVARALHERSDRSGAFIAINCGAVAAELLGSQLFGHERGAFTGAVQAHAGFFERAEGGTLFLDEITEMPAPLQVYLLRVLESRTLTRVGGSHEVPVNVRVIAATNRDPQAAVASGSLRRDLYFRLADFPIELPSLRERRDDIPLLAQRFLDRLNERYGTRRVLSAEALRQLVNRAWPGNVRELRHAVQRAYILSPGEAISAQPEVPAKATEESDGSITFRVGMTFEEVEREMLLKTLAHHDNNKRQAARTLGITAKTVYNRLLRYRSLGLIGDEQVGSEEDDEG
jgi:DNA-binding NtrC family response regulator